MVALTFLVLWLGFFGASDAFWRMLCHGRTGLARIDPLVDPGQISDHSHVVHGGGSKSIYPPVTPDDELRYLETHVWHDRLVVLRMRLLDEGVNSICRVTVNSC